MNTNYTNSQESKFQHKKPNNLNSNEQYKSMNLSNLTNQNRGLEGRYET